MSTAAQLAREEIERTPQDDDDPTPDPDATPEPEPEPEPPPTVEPPPPSVDGEAVEREYERHTKALRKLFGPLFEELQPCSHCGESMPGFEPPATVPPLEMAQDMQRCDECAGWGSVFTGARPEAQMIADCGKCHGTGHMLKSRDMTPPTPLPGTLTAVMTDGTPPTPQMPADAWERPWGHPHYAIPPAQVSA